MIIGKEQFKMASKEVVVAWKNIRLSKMWRVETEHLVKYACLNMYGSGMLCDYVKSFVLQNREILQSSSETVITKSLIQLVNIVAFRANRRFIVKVGEIIWIRLAVVTNYIHTITGYNTQLIAIYILILIAKFSHYT